MNLLQFTLMTEGSGIVHNVTRLEEKQLTTAIILAVLTLIGVFASWYIGRRAGLNEQKLADSLDHEAAVRKAAAIQLEIEQQAEAAKQALEKTELEPLTQEAVDRLFKKHHDSGKPS